MKDTMIGVDLAKNVFQLHGASMEGEVKFRRKLSRSRFSQFMSSQPPSVVVMEACAGSHHWARELVKFGHEVKLIAPRYVRPFVKRQKNDAADAEAIVEAGQRPQMRFVTPKTASQQARAMLFRVRDRLVSQRTELVNALRAHLHEYGYLAPQGIGHLQRIEEIVEDPQSDLPELARELCLELLDQIDGLSARLVKMQERIRKECAGNKEFLLLQTMPGVGPVTALAIDAFAPPMETFRNGRDFAAWLGLVPRQHSSGGKARLGRVSKAGQADIRRLLIIGAMSRLSPRGRRSIPAGSWLARMLERKPKMLVAVALANKMARALWAMLTKQEKYRPEEQAETRAEAPGPETETAAAA